MQHTVIRNTLPAFVTTSGEEAEMNHIRNEFAGKNGFNLNVIKGNTKEPWQDIIGCIKYTKEMKFDSIVICEGDHSFSPMYQNGLLTERIPNKMILYPAISVQKRLRVLGCNFYS